MAINPLYGYDTNLYGYGQANTTGSGRKYPAWMTDPNARGIGIAENYTPTPIGAIDIPRGNGLGGFNDQSVAPAAQPVEMGFGGGQATYGAEGAGAVGGFNDAVNNQPAPGFLADILGGLGLSTGQYGGPASGSSSGYGIEVDNTGMGGPAGEPGTAGFGGGTAESGSTGASGFGGSEPGSIGMYHGGIVTRNKLRGPDPDGPDDGYVAMNKGEGVLTAKALRFYGDGLVDRLNKLQVPKKAFRK